MSASLLQLRSLVQSSSTRQKVALFLVGGIASYTLLKCALYCYRGYKSNGKNNDAEQEDVIEFVDVADSRFAGALRNARRHYLEPLLHTLANVEELQHSLIDLANSKQNTKSGMGHTNVRETLGKKDVKNEATQRKTNEAQLHKAVLKADEQLTQYICKLDALPVADRVDLKERRKEMIRQANAMAQRILHHQVNSAEAIHAKEGAL